MEAIALEEKKRTIRDIIDDRISKNKHF